MTKSTTTPSAAQASHDFTKHWEIGLPPSRIILVNGRRIRLVRRVLVPRRGPLCSLSVRALRLDAGQPARLTSGRDFDGSHEQKERKPRPTQFPRIAFDRSIRRLRLSERVNQ